MRKRHGDGGMPSPVAVVLSGVAADATRAAGMAEIAAGESATIGEITFTCAAGGDDCTVTVAADGSATATGGMVTADNSAAYTTRKEAEIERATEAAKTKQTAMMAEADQTTDAGLGGSNADGTPVTTYSLAISRDSDGTTIAIADSALAREADPKFMQAADMMDGRTMHVRSKAEDAMGNVEEEVVIVATDIEAPTPTPFADVMGQTLNARDLDATRDGADGDGNTANDWTALNFDETDAAVRRLVSSGAFVPGDGSSSLHIFSDDDPQHQRHGRGLRSRGTFNGAMGMYRCDGTVDCSVTVNAMGDITAMSDGWIFTPDAGATSIVADADYLHYGFWLKRTTASDGAVTYNEVETFAGSSIATSNSVASVTGRATYEGGAVGVYAIRNAYSRTTGELADASSGHFKARASLQATFGQVTNDAGEGTIAEDMLNRLTGTIDDFELSGGEANAWSVELQRGVINEAAGTASGIAAGGGAAGSYSATFHGSVAAFDHDDDAGTPDIVPQPGAVVGEFNADFSNGRVAGAFGARKND